MKQTDLFWFWNNNQRQESLSLCYMYVLFNIFFKGHNQIRFENTNWRSSSIKFLKHSVSSFPHQELNCTCSRFLRHSWDGDVEKITQENEEVCIKHPHIGALWTHSHLPGDPVAADTQILWSQQLSVVNFMSSLSLVGISLTHCVNSWTGMILQILHLYLTSVPHIYLWRWENVKNKYIRWWDQGRQRESSCCDDMDFSDWHLLLYFNISQFYTIVESLLLI